MPFVEQEESIKYEVVEGRQIAIYRPRVEVTLKNLETGQEYISDAEALADVQNPNTDTKAEHISRSVHIKVVSIPLGASVNLG